MNANANIKDREIKEYRCKCGSVAPEWFEPVGWYDVELGPYECLECYKKRKIGERNAR